MRGSEIGLCALVAGAVWVMTTADPGPRRLRTLRLAPDSALHRPPANSRGPRDGGGRRIAALAAGLLTWTFLGGWLAPLASPAVAWAVYLVLGRLEPRAAALARERVARDLPLAIHLLAAASAAGAPPIPAMHAVASAIGGPVGAELRRIAGLASLGGDLAGTWQGLSPPSVLVPLAPTMCRALESGAPLAALLDRLADDLRARRRFELDRRARAVGVRAAAPLGLCFLPAFGLIGVVPVVAGIASDVLGTVL